MVANPDRSKPIHMTFLLIEEFSMMALVPAIEALRAANRVLGFQAYIWHFVSHDGKPVTASNGMSVEPEGEIDAVKNTEFLFVCASLIHDPPYKAKLHARLQQLDRSGVKMGAISIGTFILARAGLLKEVRCTLHWEYEPAFREEFPDIDLISALFVVDKQRYTGSGGIATMDLMLHLIEENHGEEVCLEVANQFHLDRIRNEESKQRTGSIARLENMPPAVQTAVRLMQENIEIPLSNAEIAAQIHTSVRNLERMFKRNFNSSPAKFYLSLRLEKARELLLHTNISTLEIALQSGFSSSSYFARCFLREFQKRPSDLRKRNAG